MPDFTLAREDLRDGRPWMARDRLLGSLGTRRADAEALLLLGEVHAVMRDLPAAGAAWLLTAGPDTEQRRAAMSAFRARYPKPAARAERLPMHRPLAEYPPEAVERVRALQAELVADGWSWHPPAKAQPPGGRVLRRHRDSFPDVDHDDEAVPAGRRRRWRTVLVGAGVVYVVVGFLALWVVGFVTALRWIWA